MLLLARLERGVADEKINFIVFVATPNELWMASSYS